ncbi:hypothetical protein AB0O91_27350 [Kitasatospora sp. NPDC089797]|uniref:hypothetical protein n=1 Tax=Kitasatospora sp. NPDC089797 TaxID=3155298 RepID=UPI0034139273
MNALRLLAVPAAALALTLGAVAAAPAAEARTAATVSVVGADGGTTVAANVGDTVQVDVAAVRDHTVTWYWYPPSSATPGLLAQTAGSADADGDSHATFTATAAGTGVITAIGRCVPDRGSVCPPWVVTWKVTLAVS